MRLLASIVTSLTLVVLAVGAPRDALAADTGSIILASTTSVENSGLLARVLPVFTRETGIDVHVVAQGTGQGIGHRAAG